MINKITVIILAAGKSSRFWPLSDNIQKSMVTLLGKPILEYTLLNLKKSEVEKVVLVISRSNEQFMKEYFGNGKKLGISIDYAIQEKPLGQANAILSAKDKITPDNFFVLNDYQINASEFLNDLIDFKKQKKADLVLLGKKTSNPSDYGIFALAGDQVTAIVEKPEKGKEPSDIRAVGIYLLNKDFLNFLSSQAVEEYQLETALSKFCQNKKVFTLITGRETLTLKYPWHLFKIKDYLFKAVGGNISNKANISKTAIIKNPDKVIIENEAIVGEFALIEGPVYVGKNAVLGAYSILRKGSILEEKAEVQRFSDVSNSILGKNTHLHSGFIGDSIIGENCRLGADFITANKRIDRMQIKTLVRDQLVNTNLTSLGTVIGSNTKVGIRVSIMPGKMVGKACLIGPGQIIKENLPDNSKIL